MILCRVKTQILHLETFDTIASVKDKLHWRQAEQIALVLPTQRVCGIKKELSQQLGMELLYRYAVNAGVKIAFVTKDHSIVKLAQRVGLPVFPDIQIARRANWHITKRIITKRIVLRKVKALHKQKLEDIQHLRFHKSIRVKRIHNPLANFKASVEKQRKANNLFVYLIGMVLLGGVIVFLVLPSAVINLSPVRIKQEKTLVVIAVADQSQPSLSGTIPLIKKDIRVSGEKEIQTSGYVSMYLEDATGKVRLKNLSSQEIIVPKGTAVLVENEALLSPLKMITLEEVNLPSQNGNNQDWEKDVPVLIPLRGLDKIPNLNGNLVLESSIGLDIIPEHLTIDPLKVKKLMPTTTEKDKEKLRNLLLSELIGKVKQGKELSSLDDRTRNNEVLLSEQPIDIKILQEEYVPQDDTPSEKVLLKMDLLLQWDVAVGQHYLQLGRKILDQEYGRVEGKYVIMDNVTAVFLTKPRPLDSSYQRYSSKVKFYRRLIERISFNKIYELVRGLPRNQVVRILKNNFSLEKEPTVEVYPRWLGYLPLLPFRYKVNLQ